MKSTIVPASQGRSFEVAKGQVLKITDLEGQQVGDLIAFNRDDHSEFLSGAETINFLCTIRPKSGDFIYSSKQRPMFQILKDDAHGVHDFSCAPCSEASYIHETGASGHPNCRDNLLAAVEPYGIDWLPTPMNVFMNTPADAEGTLLNLPAVTGPGAALELIALVDCVGALSSCAQDAPSMAVNGPGPSPLQIDIREPTSETAATST